MVAQEILASLHSGKQRLGKAPADSVGSVAPNQITDQLPERLSAVRFPFVGAQVFGYAIAYTGEHGGALGAGIGKVAKDRSGF
jgi:hypothetical protein